MAVNPSTLKKRIQTMKQSTPKSPSLRWSFSLMLACTLALTGLMACSDIEEGGITRSEVEDAQANINNVPTDNQPLVVVNGKPISNDLIERLNPDYIESIVVLKDKSATDEYSQKGTNGVIKITVVDRELALNNLQTDEEMKKKVDSSTSEEQIFLAVETQPELKGKMAQFQSKVQYPAECKDQGIEGRVTVQFIVDKQGQVKDPKVIRGIGGGCDEEALRVVRQAEFVPGRQRGKRVNVRMSLPIIFKLNSNNTDQPSDNTTANVVGNTMEIQSLQLNDDGTLSGKVYDKKENKPLLGANVTIKGTNKGAATNENGEFFINSFDQQNGIIRISFVGYQTMNIDF
jgi:TonB family protein